MNDTSKDRLVKIFSDTDISTLEDSLSCLMATIEDGLLQSGFIPQQDYTRNDLFIAAMPLISEMFNKKNLSFSATWPEYIVKSYEKRQKLCKNKKQQQS